MKNFIAYTRVSTSKQEHGKDAQLSSMETYVDSVKGKIIHEFSENASGKNDNRVELQNAIKKCKETGATLLVAKLDRLSRKVAFLFTLKDQLMAEGIEIVVSEMPETIGNTMMLGVFASVAQHEREIISKRTKDGLAAAKAKGVILGRPKGYKHSPETIAKISKSNKSARAIPLNDLTAHILKEGLKDGLNISQIAVKLNDAGCKAPKGGKLSPTQVSRMSKKLKGDGK